MAGKFRQRRNGNGGNGRARGMRSNADRVQAQGVGNVPPKAFGTTNSTALALPSRMPRAIATRAHDSYWDAMHPSHLPLPRSVGPYTVIRTTKLISTSAKMIIFSPSLNNDGGWNASCAVSAVTPSVAINAANNSYLHSVPFPGSAVTGSGLTAVPAALSVQLMNPNALQTTSGIVAGAVAHTQMEFEGRMETWNDMCQHFVSYMRPRLMAAGKLALRGVQANAYPLNMAALANFEHVLSKSDGPFTWGGASGYYPAGLSPIVVMNENEIELRYLVTIEWRVRFDMANPAVASHQHYPVTSDSFWDAMVRRAVSLGNGIKDISDTVASVGQGVEAVRTAVNRAGRPLLALTA